MDNAIRQIAHQLGEEAKAIIEYTNSIQATDDTTLKAVFLELRNDELAHAQKLLVALTEVMGGNEPETAEKMDAEDGSGGDG